MKPTPLRGIVHPSYIDGYWAGYTEHRYGLAEPTRRKHERILRGKERRSVLSRVTGILRRWHLSHFEYEGNARTGLRSGLCLAGHPWAAADEEAAEIVAEALSNIGAKRPSWYAGQPEATTPVENCMRCGLLLPDIDRNKRRRFCSDLCEESARLYRTEIFRIVDKAAYDDAYYAARKEDMPERDCIVCGTRFRPAWATAQACSHVCAQRSKATYVKPRPCAHCGTMFRGRRRSRFCSTACGNAGRQVELPDRKCEICSSTFTPTVGQARYCSDPCATQAANAKRREKHAAARPDRPCEECETVFSPATKRARFCSELCYKRNSDRIYRARKKEREQAGGGYRCEAAE